jgi:hypothetical protein
LDTDTFNKLSERLRSDPEGEQVAELLFELLSGRATRNGLYARLLALKSELDETPRTRPVGTQRALIEMVEESGPLTTDEVMALAEEYGYRSLRFKQHASSMLNRAVDAGQLGKIRRRPTGLFFGQPEDAVREALKQIGKVPAECGVADLTELAKITGLRIETVDETLVKLIG